MDDYYLLTLQQVSDLFDYVEVKLKETGCNHRGKPHTMKWLEMNISEEKRQDVLTEIESMAGLVPALSKTQHIRTVFGEFVVVTLAGGHKARPYVQIRMQSDKW